MALGVVLLGAAVGLTRDEWLWIVAAIGAVLAAEAFNSAVERLGDAVSPGPHPSVGAAKDLAAGGVLIAALVALAIGAMIFAPHVVALAR